MSSRLFRIVALAGLFLASAQVLHAQRVRVEIQTTDRSDRAIVESTLSTVRTTVSDVLSWVGKEVDATDRWVESRVRRMENTETLEEIQAAVREVEREIRRMEIDARDDGKDRVARELRRVKRQLDQVDRELRRAQREVTAEVQKAVREAERAKARQKVDRAVRSKSKAQRRNEWTWGRHQSDFGYGIDPFGAHIVTMFGAEPFYPALPGLRYNRVDGLVLGLDVEPIRLTSSRRSKIYGQIGYAFALEDVRYHAGFETRIGQSRRSRAELGLTLGASYHENTMSDDTWKIDQWENSMAAFFFRNDFLDYYEGEGWNVYAIKSLRLVDGSLRLGYSSEDQRSLLKNTNWSLFRDRDFRENPAIEDGRMNTVLIQLEAGDFYSFSRQTQGGAFRAVAELGDGFGGDFTFNRYFGDARLFQPLGSNLGLGLRARAGYASEGTPLQRLFTVGGIGTVRAYPQNLYAGTRLLLGNAELTFTDVDVLLTDAQVFGFADAAWVGSDFDAFDLDDVWSDAGVGLSLDERHIRFEIAWPLDDPLRSKPTFWFRLNPTF